MNDFSIKEAMKEFLQVNNEHINISFWVIFDPQQGVLCTDGRIIGMVTGIFYSRKEAEEHLKLHQDSFSKQAKPVCMTGNIGGGKWRAQRENPPKKRRNDG